MKNLRYLLLSLVALITLHASAQQTTDSLYQVKGFAIAAPRPNGVADFIKFINEELAPRKVNTLILRVDYNFEFKSHPELRDSICLSKKDVKKIVEACKDHNISIIPQVNLLGHQSWASKLGSLLKVYPEFDENAMGKNAGYSRRI